MPVYEGAYTPSCGTAVYKTYGARILIARHLNIAPHDNTESDLTSVIGGRNIKTEGYRRHAQRVQGDTPKRKSQSRHTKT